MEHCVIGLSNGESFEIHGSTDYVLAEIENGLEEGALYICFKYKDGSQAAFKLSEIVTIIPI